MRRKPRHGEYVCRCIRYDFPHRFSGGRCDGHWVVRDQWFENYGGGECRNCACLNRTESETYCEVITGQEKPKACPVLESFIRRHDIIVYRKRGAKPVSLYPSRNIRTASHVSKM